VISEFLRIEALIQLLKIAAACGSSSSVRIKMAHKFHVSFAEGAGRTMSRDVALRSIMEDWIAPTEWEKRTVAAPRQTFEHRLKYHL